MMWARIMRVTPLPADCAFISLIPAAIRSRSPAHSRSISKSPLSSIIQSWICENCCGETERPPKVKVRKVALCPSKDQLTDALPSPHSASTERLRNVGPKNSTNRGGGGGTNWLATGTAERKSAPPNVPQKNLAAIM